MKEDFNLWIKSINKEITLNDDKVLIGRFYKCTVCLQNRSISRLHAEIFHKHDEWYIKDLDSSNGTWLNGERLLPWEEYKLHENDMISICRNKEVLCFNRCTPEENESSAERSFVKTLCSFGNCGDDSEVAFDLIIHMLLKYPMYVLLASENSTLSIGDSEILSDSDFIEKAVFSIGTSKMIPLFTSTKKAGVNGTFMRLHPCRWLPLIAKTKKTVIINPFQKERFLLPHLFIIAGILPYLQD